MAAIASTTGTARGKTQGSCRPCALKVTASPCRFTVCCDCKIVATGLKATRKKMSCPLLRPPCMPPLWLVRVVTPPRPLGKNTSFCSLPRAVTPAKPSPYSKPFTALMPSIALPSAACSLSNSGSPKPTGHPFITQLIMPPMVSPSAFT